MGLMLKEQNLMGLKKISPI